MRLFHSGERPRQIPNPARPFGEAGKDTCKFLQLSKKWILLSNGLAVQSLTRHNGWKETDVAIACLSGLLTWLVGH